jgi:hypothetical protein
MAPSWSRNKKVPGFFDTEAPKTNLTPNTYNYLVLSLNSKDQSTLISLAQRHNMRKSAVFALSNLRHLYTSLSEIRDIQGNIDVNLVHLMYDILEAVLSHLTTGIDPQEVKSFIFGPDYKLSTLIDDR